MAYSIGHFSGIVFYFLLLSFLFLASFWQCMQRNAMSLLSVPPESRVLGVCTVHGPQCLAKFAYFRILLCKVMDGSRQTDWKTDRQTGIRTYVQTDRLTDAQAERQTKARRQWQRASACHSVSRQFSHCRFPFRNRQFFFAMRICICIIN